VLWKRRKVPRVALLVATGSSYVVEKEQDSDSIERKREKKYEEMNVDRKEKRGVTLSLRLEQSLQGRGAARNENGLVFFDILFVAVPDNGRTVLFQPFLQTRQGCVGVLLRSEFKYRALSRGCGINCGSNCFPYPRTNSRVRVDLC
jgi:hypothetical protein